MSGRHLSSPPGSPSSSARPDRSTSRPGGRSSKREQVAAACFECRTKKVKCDAVRPTCGRCSARSLICYYDVEPDTTRAVALKRKHENVQEDLDRMTELYGYIRSRPDAEVTEIVRQIRLTADPFAVLKLIRDGDLLLQRTGSKPNSDTLLRQLDADALQQSRIKVRARPWTSVAGDGIVSHLMTRGLQHSINLFIDEEALTLDMAMKDYQNARYCSPLLVNALCALGTFNSNFAAMIDSGASEVKLYDRFIGEARKHLDDERGRLSLPTMQALFLLYLCSTSLGQDRAGLVFRLSGVDMFKRMKAGMQVLPRDPRYSESAHRRICSRNAWGLFCAESLIAYTYLQPSRIPIPTLPRYFVEGTGYARTDFTIILTSEDVLEARSHLLSIFYRIASYKAREPHPLGSEADIKTRQRLNDALTGWVSVLPPRTRYGPDQSAHYHLLRAHYYLSSMILWRPLQDIAVQLESGDTPATFCINNCTNVLDELEHCIRHFPDENERGNLALLWCCQMMGFTLILMLRRHHESIEPLVRVTRLLNIFAKYWPGARALLLAMYAISLQLQVELPDEAREYCVSLEKEDSLAGLDTPVSWTVPRHADFQDLGRQDDESDGGIEVGDLISKWAAFAIK